MSKVVTIGELMMRITPKNKERLNQTQDFKTFYGGAEANVAMTFAKIGHNVRFVSVFPNNDIGDRALAHLESGRVNTSWVFKSEKRLGMYFHEEGYSLKPAKVIYDRENSGFRSLPNMNVDWKLLYQDVDLLHITGITPALSEDLRKFTLEAIKMAKKNAVKVSFDFNYRSKLWSKSEAKKTFLEILPNVDICFAGYKDFILLLEENGSDIFDEDLLKKFYKKYSHIYNIQCFASSDRTVISAHENKLRVFMFQNDHLYKTNTYAIDIIDRIGGGDAFAAGIIHGMLTEKSYEEIVQFGIASGVLKHI